MIKRYLALVVSGVFLGGICLSMTPGYDDNSSPRYPRNVKPGVSDNSYDSQQPQQPQQPYSGRQQVAYMDGRDEDIHHRANRMGDWDYKQNWRYDRKAFYGGETQGEAYEEEHDPYKGGIGTDPDREIMQMRRYYEEDYRRNQQNANYNQRNPNQRSNMNNQNRANQRYPTNTYGNGYSNQSSYRNQGNYNNGDNRGSYDPYYYQGNYQQGGY
jgi:hypothetical protein